MGQTVFVEPASAKEYSVKIDYSGQAQEKEVEELTRDYCSSLKVGDMFSYYDLRDFLLSSGLEIKRLYISCEAQSRADVNEYCVVDIREVCKYE